MKVKIWDVGGETDPVEIDASTIDDAARVWLDDECNEVVRPYLISNGAEFFAEDEHGHVTRYRASFELTANVSKV